MSQCVEASVKRMCLQQVPKSGIIVPQNTTKLVMCSTAAPVIQRSSGPWHNTCECISMTAVDMCTINSLNDSHGVFTQTLSSNFKNYFYKQQVNVTV